MTAIRALLLVGVALTACAKSVIPDYELRRDAALAPPAPAPEAWRPDAALAFSPALLRGFVQSGLDRSGNLKKKVDLGGRAYITPSLHVQRLNLAESRTCRECLRVDADLEGTVSWRIGNSSGEQPLAGALTFELALEARREGWTWEILGKPRSVSKAKLEIDGKTFKTVEKLAEGAIQDWAQNHVFDAMPPILLARLDVAQLPLRAARAVSSDGGGVRVEMLSESSLVPDKLAEPTLAEGEDWAVTIADGALLHIARKQAFAMGPLVHEVVVEPLALSLQDGAFAMDIRLWRVKGRGWWRDVRATGTWAKTDRGFHLSAVKADEIGQSKGAKFADPLAALVEGRILEAVEEAVETTLPGGRAGEIGGVRVGAEVQRVQAVPGGIIAGGTARIGEVGKPPPPKRVGP